MITIFIRTLIIYVVLIATMRLMGKRQIGELEVTDLVTTLLISEIASLPLTNLDIPLSHAILPILLLLILEVFSSVILLRFPKLKGLVSARPTVIIQRGVLRPRALRDVRISLEELMSEIRQQGLSDITQVQYAILEKNGKLTVLPKARYAPITPEQADLKVKEDALMHIVFSNGQYSPVGLSLIGKDVSWLRAALQRRGLVEDNLFCVTANEDGALFWIVKEDEK